MIQRPSLAEGNGDNQGRDAAGRFTSNNRHGVGNPMARKVNRLRVAMLAAVTDAEMKRIMAKLIELATDGNVSAAKEVLDRTVGSVALAELRERVERMEQLMGNEQ